MEIKLKNSHLEIKKKLIQLYENIKNNKYEYQ